MIVPSQASSEPREPTDMPKAGWVSILKRAVKQFKHDDVIDRAAALTYFNKELNDQNGVADNLNLIGHVLLSDSKSCDDQFAREAMKYFEESLSIRLAHDFKSGLADSYNTIGRQKFNCGELKEAAQIWRDALRIDSGNAWIKNNLDRVERELVNLKTSKKDVE